MKQWMKIILVILGLPKSIWLNFRLLPLTQAIKMPILVSPITKIISTRGRFEIRGPVRLGLITFGLCGYGLSVHEPCVIQNNGHLVFQGKIRCGGGTKICCNSNGTIFFGKNIEFVGLCSIICNKSISFGSDCLISWDTQIMDTDMHPIFYNCSQTRKNPDMSVTIGDHVWICSRVSIFKGTAIGNDIVIGGSTVVRGNHDLEKTIICGNPGKDIVEGITWGR